MYQVIYNETVGNDFMILSCRTRRFTTYSTRIDLVYYQQQECCSGYRSVGGSCIGKSLLLHQRDDVHYRGSAKVVVNEARPEEKLFPIGDGIPPVNDIHGFKFLGGYGCGS